MQAEKRYVEVVVRFREDGRMLPRTIVWEDGRLFPVDRVLAVSPAPALRAGGQGDRYTIRVGGQVRYLFFERALGEGCGCPGRWFVEASVQGRRSGQV